MGSSSAGEYNWRAYDAETSKTIEMYFVAMGPDRTSPPMRSGLRRGW